MALYRLVGKKPVREDNITKWGMEMEDRMGRIVGNDTVNDMEISTVFLGVDHNYSGKGKPILFETMIFGGTLDGYTARYETYDEAEHSHKALVEFIGSITHYDESFLELLSGVRKSVKKAIKKERLKRKLDA